MKNDKKNNKKKYLSFYLDDEVYAIDIEYIIQIIPNQKITGVPDVAEYVKGIINVRGIFIPVIDLKVLFSKNSTDYGEKCSIIILEDGNQGIGIPVDRTKEFFDLMDKDLSLPQKKGTKKSQNYLKGIISDKNNSVLILEVEKILNNIYLKED